MREFQLISKIRTWAKNDSRVLRGIGDDAAVLKFSKEKDLLFTTDMLVEGRHFRVGEATPPPDSRAKGASRRAAHSRRESGGGATAYEIGRKALAVNISDIAAMGGVPTHAVAAVGLPKVRTGVFAKELYRGMNALAKRFGVNLVGGDTNRSDRLVLSVALLGEVEKGRAVLRSGARAGDAVFVTGALGGSYRSKKHLRFTPRLKEARWLVKNFKLHAMMDLSDGLASDLRRIAEESRVGFVINEEALPVSPHAKNVRTALCEGEDFELLFTAATKDAKEIEKKFYRIGRVVPKKRGIVLLKKTGEKMPIKGGYDHFQ